jgi:hypothetical protein
MGPTSELAHGPTPYRDAAHTYRAAGWIGVLPVPLRAKKPVPTGWSGHGGGWPSGADIQTWVDSDKLDEGAGNIALRLPPDVVGVDVDAYGTKAGAATFAEAIDRWGPLPDTWKSTARDDGTSGIRLYRVPEGLRWPGQVGPGIEMVHVGHRYTMVWPSLHPEGRIYRWYRPDGLVSTAPPRVDDIPDMPEAWVNGLTDGELAEQVTFADLSTSEGQQWLLTHSRPGMCRAMTTVLERLTHEAANGDAHESLRRLMGLIRLGEQGHAGLTEALGVAYTAFLTEATRAGRSGTHRDQAEAEGEWRRSLNGALRRVLGDPSVAEGEQPDDPCTQPFAGLVNLTAGATAGANALATIEIPRPEQPAPAAAAAPDSVEQQPAAEPVVVERTSWWPRDLTAALAGEQTEPEPAVLARDDKHCLFYLGKINGLLGESESGKTWVLLAAVAQELTAGRPVLYVDFEDTDTSIVARLTALGVPTETLDPATGLFTYLAPDESLHGVAAKDLAEVLTLQTYSLIGLDGVNAGMTLLGLDLLSNTDATQFAQKLLKPLAKTGAAVVTVDHVPKDKEARGKGGIGAQAKRAMITGCALGVEVLAPFGRGTTGKLKLTVDKDRPGHVRGVSEFAKNAGIAVLHSNADTGSVSVHIEAPNCTEAGEREPFRPTGAMEKISRLLATTDGPLSSKQIEVAVEGRSSIIRAALEALVAGGYISRHPGPRNAVLHRYEHTFREVDDLADATDGGGDDDY